MGSMGGQSASGAIVERVMVQEAPIGSLPGRAQLLVVLFGEDARSFPICICFVFVVPHAGCCAPVDVVFVPAKANGADGEDECNKFLDSGMKGTLLF